MSLFSKTENRKAKQVLLEVMGSTTVRGKDIRKVCRKVNMWK
jgi:hypothetical protein